MLYMTITADARDALGEEPPVRHHGLPEMLAHYGVRPEVIQHVLTQLADTTMLTLCQPSDQAEWEILACCPDAMSLPDVEGVPWRPGYP